LAPFSNSVGGFWDDYGGTSSNIQHYQIWLAGYENPYIAFPVTENGKSNCVSLISNPAEAEYHSSADNELDGTITPIAVGDHIVFQCYLATTASSNGDTNDLHGAELSIAVYDASEHGISELTSSTGQSDYTLPNLNSPTVVVPWGTPTFTLITIDFTVQSTYAADGYQGGFTAGQMVAPAFMAPQITMVDNTNIGGPTETGIVYAWNPIVYITS